MNFFEKEMRQMFGNNEFFHEAKFLGKTMLANLNNDLRVKLQFISSHISGHYDTVQMVSSTCRTSISVRSPATDSAPAGNRWTTIWGNTTIPNGTPYQSDRQSQDH